MRYDGHHGWSNERIGIFHRPNDSVSGGSMRTQIIMAGYDFPDRAVPYYNCCIFVISCDLVYNTCSTLCLLCIDNETYKEGDTK